MSTPKFEARSVADGVASNDSQVDEFLEFDEFDTEHLLWEEIKGLVYLMREVDATLVDDGTVEQVLRDLDTVKLKLLKFRRRTGDFS